MSFKDDPIMGPRETAKERKALGEIAENEAQAIVAAAQIAAESFDKATQIANEQFEKVFAIAQPEIKMRQEVMADIQREISGSFEESETGKFETKMLERGLAKRGLQRSGLAIEGVKDLSMREAERNLARKYSFAGLSGAGQQIGVSALNTLGSQLTSFAIGSGQARAQGLQSAAFARGQGARAGLQLTRQDDAARRQNAMGIASAFL